MRGLASSISTAIALMALACAWSLAGCGGNDNSGASNQPSTNASAKNDSSGGGGEAGTAQSEPGDRATRAGSQSPSGSAPVTPVGPTGQDQQAFPQALRHPKGTNEPHKPHKSHSSGKPGGNSTPGLTPQESAAYETARALCANPDSLQYAPEEIRDDAEALAEFAERFAPPGEEQIVHDGCLVGLKSIGIG